MRFFIFNSFVFVFLAGCLLSCTQTEKIENSLTDQHIKVQGMSIEIIPPIGYFLDMQQAGFYGQNSFIVIERHEMPLKALIPYFSDSSLTKEGITIKSNKNLQLNDIKGKLLTLTEATNGLIYEKQVLLIENGSSSFVVNGTYPADSLRIKEIISQSLKSILVSPEVKTDSSSVFFSFPYLGSLKVSQILNAGIRFTNTGNIDWAENDVFLDAYVQFLTVRPEDQQDFVKQSISYLNQEALTAAIAPITLVGINGFEVIDKDEQRQMYRVYLFGNNRVYQLIGASRVNHESNLAIFRRISAEMTILQ